ncbi:nuclear pore complex protein Nup54-like isoform X2 [Rhopilema esculentum]|uniref:nuclear pore complex protein Nup54-like isoform X1 n=1 Tax=Rhopilema esculentum TaxID=499914 RepID=UPI0031E06DE0|eukprot:gene844-10590_t
MAAQFSFGAPAQSQANPFGGFGSSTTGTSLGTATSNTGFGSFGLNTAPTATGGLFGGLNTGFNAGAKTTGKSLFGTATSTSGLPFGGSGTSGFGTAAFGTKTTSATGFSFPQPTAGFAMQQSQQQQQQQLMQQQQQALNPLNAMTTAISMPALFGDERDSILAKFNQIQALWGAGKGYYAANQQPIDFTMDNPFCRFKTIGYSCLPNAKDSEGLVALDLKHKLEFVKTNQQQLVESLHKVLGSKPTLVVCVDGVRELPEDKTEVIFYVVERAANGTSRRVPSTELYMFLSQANLKSYLANLGAESMLPKTSLSESQLESFLENPPLGIDPIIWEQAKKDNPLPKRLIPVPLIGFSELVNRLKHQEHEAEQHKNRIDLMFEEIGQLQRAHSTTMAKLADYKRRHIELGHRVLEVMMNLQISKRTGYAIEPEEEQLRIQFESIQAELNSPMHLKGRLHELMSQIRLQSHGAVQRTEPKYAMDENMKQEIRQHLENQQNGILQLINIVKDDLDDLRTMGLELLEGQAR